MRNYLPSPGIGLTHRGPTRDQEESWIDNCLVLLGKTGGSSGHLTVMDARCPVIWRSHWTKTLLYGPTV